LKGSTNKISALQTKMMIYDRHMKFNLPETGKATAWIVRPIQWTV